MKKMILALVCVLTALQSFSQTEKYKQDVSSEDAIIAALYDVISGEPNTTRDWARFRNLFLPESRLIPTRKNDAGDLILKTLTPEEYVTLFQSRVATGFFERELSRKTESYGTVVHIFSTYETKEKKDGPVTNRGINSIQLFKDKNRYYIVNIFWCAESMGFSLPEKYLK
ncbi:MAG: hypothetical protein ACK5RG_10250 [Cyclobacteriaceae bacterium]|jgi:hypothetical protein|nr:hypothetical protein [Flammeovirgaceae bacterium]